jgi:DEK C terminal domain
MATPEVVRAHIAAAVRRADLTTVTPKQVRRSVERELDLQEGFLGEDRWRKMVGQAIRETMATMEDEQGKAQLKKGRETQKKPAQLKKLQEQTAREIDQVQREETNGKTKKRKRIVEDTPPTSPTRLEHTTQTVVHRSLGVATPPPDKPTYDSDSELSVLNDATPPTKSHKASRIKQPISRVKPTASKASNTVDEEIKTLKSLVFKCGVRKNW